MTLSGSSSRGTGKVINMIPSDKCAHNANPTVVIISSNDHVTYGDDNDNDNDNDNDSSNSVESGGVAVACNTADNIASLVARMHLDGITEEDMKRTVSKSECTKLVLGLSREVAVYCCLNMGVGGMSDCFSLREELKTSSNKLYDQIMLCKKRIMPLILSKRLKEEDRLDLERVYRIFSGCLEMIQTECIRSIALQAIFPLWDSSTLLIQTGVTDNMTKKTCASILAEQMAASVTQRKASDLEELTNLKRRVASFQELSYCTSQIMDVKPWDYKPDPDLTKIDVETTEPHTHIVEHRSIIATRSSRHRKWIIIFLVIGGLIVIGGILGLALALPKEDSPDDTLHN